MQPPRPRSWNCIWRHYSAAGGSVGMTLCSLMRNSTLITVIWSKYSNRKKNSNISTNRAHIIYETVIRVIDVTSYATLGHFPLLELAHACMHTNLAIFNFPLYYIFMYIAISVISAWFREVHFSPSSQSRQPHCYVSCTWYCCIWTEELLGLMVIQGLNEKKEEVFKCKHAQYLLSYAFINWQFGILLCFKGMTFLNNIVHRAVSLRQLSFLFVVALLWQREITLIRR